MKAAVVAILMFLASIGSVLAAEMVAVDQLGMEVRLFDTPCKIEAVAKAGAEAKMKIGAARVTKDGAVYEACHFLHEDHIDVVVLVNGGLMDFPVPLDEFRPAGKPKPGKGKTAI